LVGCHTQNSIFYSDWCAYAEIEYQHLVAAERSETIWDDVGAELESCPQLDMDGDKMLSTVERLFNGDVDFAYVENLRMQLKKTWRQYCSEWSKPPFPVTKNIA
jgi:hypothetical protein